VVPLTPVVWSASANAEGGTATFKDGGTPLRAMLLSGDSAFFDIILAASTQVLYAELAACRGPWFRPASASPQDHEADTGPRARWRPWPRTLPRFVSPPAISQDSKLQRLTSVPLVLQSFGPNNPG
jgi:hypothetical protein